MGSRTARLLVCAIVPPLLLASCSRSSGAPPRGSERSPYWIADPLPKPFHLAWAQGEIFHYEQSPSGPSMNVTTERRSCPDLSDGIGVVASKVNGHIAYEDAAKDGGQPFGWSVEWEPAPSICIEVVVDNMKTAYPPHAD